MNLLTMVLLGIFLGILLWKAQIVPRGEAFEQLFPLEVSKGLQGFLGMVILIHHVAVYLNNLGLYSGELGFFESVGIFCIGFFFFSSGYGLMVSLHTKENYLKGFLKKRVLMILVPFFICNYLFMFGLLLLGVKLKTSELLMAFFGIRLLNSQMWYAVEIMLLYLAFYLVFRLVKKEGWCLFLLGIVILSFTVYGMRGGAFDFSICPWFFGEWWYNTTPMFLAGMVVAAKRERLRQWIHKYYYPVLGIAAVVFGVFTYFHTMVYEQHGYWTGWLKDRIITYFFQVGWVISFVLLVVLILQKVRFRNRVLEFLGKFSLEIVLINGLFLELFLKLEVRLGLVPYLVFSLVCTALAATVIYRIKMFILERKS